MHCCYRVCCMVDTLLVYRFLGLLLLQGHRGSNGLLLLLGLSNSNSLLLLLGHRGSNSLLFLLSLRGDGSNNLLSFKSHTIRVSCWNLMSMFLLFKEL